MRTRSGAIRRAAGRVHFERAVHLRVPLHAVLHRPVASVLDIVVAPADGERLRVEPSRERMARTLAL